MAGVGKVRDTRLAVLQAIRTQGQATVASLAAALGISPIAVRHHLTSLQAEGLLNVTLARQAVGRPKHVYSLSEAAEHYFTPAHTFAERFLQQLKASLTSEQLVAIIDRMAEKVAVRYGLLHLEGSLEERLQKLVDILGEEGFRAAVRRVESGTLQAELSCPYVFVGQRHAETCRIERTIIRSVLGQDVQRTACMLDGDRLCIFSVVER
ncbi:MAG: ArsR family transcriptional regulator [Anaerolineae bacterium]|nr:ArsR family transcriptional regulator [Anaerolineae bacterium]MDW8298943.1 ArsR family transcriptional regulator [Anaerolineae bacterium]